MSPTVSIKDFINMFLKREREKMTLCKKLEEDAQSVCNQVLNCVVVPILAVVLQENTGNMVVKSFFSYH